MFNKSYVWTTLANHIQCSDEEIFSLCGVNLVFLGETTYGIIRKIRVPQVSMPVSNQNKPSRASISPPTGKIGKTTCRSNTKQPTKCGRGAGRCRGRATHTLSESREVNYGIPAQHTAVQSTNQSRLQIDYLALNDGLEEDTKPSPKKKKRVTHRPKSAPSTARIAAQKSMSSPESECRSPIPSPTSHSTLSGVPLASTSTLEPSSKIAEQEDGLSGVPEVNIDKPTTDFTKSAADVPLAGIPPLLESTNDELLPDLVLNRGMATNETITTSIPSTSTAPESQQDLEAASVLLNLQEDIHDDTLDEADADDNAVLMPIGGIGAAVDVAPQNIRLDQPNVDAAIAKIGQNELNQEEIEATGSKQQPNENRDQSDQIEQNSEELNAKPTGSRTEEDVPDEPKKGSLRMKGYGLK